MTSKSSLDAFTQRAGAVIVKRNGARVAAHFGSPAAELSVCVQTVGLSDRSDLGKLGIGGSSARVDELVLRLTGTLLAAEGVVLSDGAWWCAAERGRIIVVCERDMHPRLLSLLRAQARRLPNLTVADCSTSLAAIAIVGRYAMRVLSALGALGPDGDTRAVPPFGNTVIAGTDLHVLLQSDRRALLIVEALAAHRVWSAVQKAGRTYGLSLVGAEAIDRFSLVERARIGAPPAAVLVC